VRFRWREQRSSWSVSLSRAVARCGCPLPCATVRRETPVSLTPKTDEIFEKLFHELGEVWRDKLYMRSRSFASTRKSNERGEFTTSHWFRRAPVAVGAPGMGSTE
jgi:hypothetical protein